MTLSDPHRFSEGVRERCAGSAETLDLIERDVDDWVRRFKVARAMALYEESRLREVGTRTARRQIGHLFASAAIRIVDLASGMTLLVNENHAHAAFATARSLVETAGVPVYVAKNVVPQLKKGRAERVDEVLRRLTVGIDPGIGARVPDGATGEHSHPIRVGALIDALCSELDVYAAETPSERATGREEEAKPPSAVLRQNYSLLSDHTHPNHNAMHLSVTLTEEGMEWSRGGPIDEDDLTLIVATVGLAMYCSGQAFDEGMRVANAHPLELA